MTQDGATLSGSFSGVTTTVQEVGFQWGTTSNPSGWNEEDLIQSESDVLGNHASGSFTADLDGLGDGRTYYYRAYIGVLEGGVVRWYYGEVKSFTTQVDTDKPSTVAGWFELPVMNAKKSGSYLVKDGDSNVYYAYHMSPDFKIGGKEARNYTVAFSASDHCPIWVAAPRHAVYESGSGRSESYKADPDIPADIQYSSKSTGGGCNKGHMLGSAERTVTKSTNAQVFYYSNIAPQLSSGFNTGGGGWNILEEFVDDFVCSDTLYVVIGTYFKKYTDGYGYTVNPSKISFGGRTDVSMPTMFYYLLIRTKSGQSGKALKNCTADEIQCAAFVRAHTNSLKNQEVTSQEMMSVADLEAITGFTYFPNVPNAPKTTVRASDWGL